MAKYCFISVLYAKRPCESETVQSLSRLDFLQDEAIFCFWDNSPLGFKNELDDVLGSSDFRYFTRNNNTSLSEIYNTVIDNVVADVYVILDDDSVINEHYLGELYKFEISSDLVGCPKIFHDKVLISPGYVKGVRGYSLTVADLDKGTEGLCITSMMSGTAIKKEVFEKVRFDEALIFYGIDTKFYIDCNRQGLKIKVFDFKMCHESALRNYTSTSEHIKRLDMLFRSKKIIFSHLLFSNIRVFTYSTLVIFKLCLMQRDFRYISLLKLFL